MLYNVKTGEVMKSEADIGTLLYVRIKGVMTRVRAIDDIAFANEKYKEDRR